MFYRKNELKHYKATLLEYMHTLPGNFIIVHKKERLTLYYNI